MASSPVVRLAASFLLGLCCVAGTGGCASLMVTGAVDPGEAAEEAAELARQVRSALSANRAIDSSTISVSASGAVVTLNGEVRTNAERDQAVRTTAAVAGVGRVVNRLIVDAT